MEALLDVFMCSKYFIWESIARIVLFELDFIHRTKHDFSLNLLDYLTKKYKNGYQILDEILSMVKGFVNLYAYQIWFNVDKCFW